jgi:hypothetical protein
VEDAGHTGSQAFNDAIKDAIDRLAAINR